MEMEIISKSYLSSFHEVLEQEASAIISLKEVLDEETINRAIEMILTCNGRVVVTGVGKSGIIGRKINATLASTGTPSLFLHPAEGLHGDLGMVTKEDIVIAISNSGESDEVLRLIPSINKIGAKMIAIVQNTKSTLAVKSDLVLSIGDVTEACPLGLAPTTSTTVTLALGDALAVALLKARDFKPEDFAVYHPSGSLGRKLLLTVQDVVVSTNKNPVVHGNVSIKEALFLMTAQGMGATSVVDEHDLLVGILTDGDIRRAFALSDNVLLSHVDDLCNRNPIVITSDMLAVDALKIMEERKINVLPVADSNNRPIGMIHIHDLMKLGI
ncbi:KpsF/GutQ family sugar-phosphate isomerase [Metabacillus sediminilitoris]|uniref:KpsF/GutQ family sugar-phosphate isomerase n=2 Tax=Metabacillus sediminilitoris TaxID=2567941 RepID=A0A4S4C1D4_9BACI|nr:KpsF/GutQ family sugar-phosphate isomerase [Metabacillus sediminilitoris]QGQ48176.1 KpsF/GutQ family sugar-phosphate isomerase [Metabacillus sediminilitoris]THF81463.1 KpsF/GutQ family sugar-phosphate isomerase [Metabacillus sediminilitoris]